MGYRGVPAPGRKVVARTIEIIIKIFVFYRYLLVQNIFIIIIHSSFLPAERGSRDAYSPSWGPCLGRVKDNNICFYWTRPLELLYFYYIYVILLPLPYCNLYTLINTINYYMLPSVGAPHV